MPVTLFSGLPGAGKTAQLVAELVRLRDAEPGRPLFAMGINGLKEGIASELTMDQLHAWWELPPGSIIAIDECQEDHLMPKDRGTPSQWVQRITKVRHHGMDFLLTTQHPGNMSAYVRRLVDKHVHTVRKFGTSVVSRYTWGRCMDDPEKRAAQKSAVEDFGTLPKEVFELYKSSSLHTMKPRIPRKVYTFIALVVIGIGAAVAVPVLIKRAQQHNTELIQGDTPAVSSGAPGSRSTGNEGDADARLRREDFAKWMQPRVPGLPWSAPMFDRLEVKAQPKLYCIAVEDGRCSCMTEQGTHYAVPVDRCRAIVADGLYNPFDAGIADAAGRRKEEPRTDQRASPAPAGVPIAPGDATPSRHERATASAYVPPTYAEWNPDALTK